MNKKKLVCIILLFVLLLSLVSFSVKSAYGLGDPMTLSQISSIAYVLGQSSGINWGFSQATSSGVNDQMQRAVNNWLNGRTVVEAFGTEIARIEMGRLIVPATLYNGIRSFLNDFIEDNDLESGRAIVFQGYLEGGIPLDFLKTDYGYTQNGFSATLTYKGAGQPMNNKGYTFDVYYNGNRIGGHNLSAGTAYYTIFEGYTYKIENSVLQVGYLYSQDYENKGKRSYHSGSFNTSVSSPTIYDQGEADIYGGYTPTVLNPDQYWTGTIGGQDWPDTNLDQLLGQVDQDVADNNLDVEGEVGPIDPPTPPPEPIDPDTPLSDVPWEGLNDLGTQLTDSIENAIGGQTGTITGSIDDAAEGIEGAIEDSVTQGATVVSGAIQQAVNDVNTSIGEQTGALSESIENVGVDVQSIAEALEAPEIDEKTFDLRELFPFCIPFDIYHLLQKFDGSPTAPHVYLPIVIPSLNFSYIMDLDFSPWDPVAATMRTVELIVYALGLAWATSKVIKW